LIIVLILQVKKCEVTSQTQQFKIEQGSDGCACEIKCSSSFGSVYEINFKLNGIPEEDSLTP